MSEMLPLLGEDSISIGEVCKIIRSLAKNTKNRKHLQKVASDILAIDKLSDIIVNDKALNGKKKHPFSDKELVVDEEESTDDLTIKQKSIVLRTLAALTSDQEICRKKLVENK